jgi:hypothetical protein
MCAYHDRRLGLPESRSIIIDAREDSPRLPDGHWLPSPIQVKLATPEFKVGG